MSRPPSPIAPPSSTLCYTTSDTLKNNNNTYQDVDEVDDDDNAPFKDVYVEKMNRINQLGEPHPQLNYTYGSIVDDSCTSKPDPEDLQQDLLELEHTNRRLNEENVELNHQITTSEEANSSLRQRCQQLEHALNSVQHQLSGARRMEEEIEELRSALDAEREEKGHLLSKVTSLEKDNTTLSNRLKELQVQLANAQEDIENLNLQEAQLVEEHKAEVNMLAQKLHQYKAEAFHEAEINKFLTESAEELRKINEALREEKTSLEEQLLMTKGKLAAMTSRADHEISGDVEDESLPGIPEPIKSIVPKLPWGPVIFSSPFPLETSRKSLQDTPLSIHSEIQTMSDNIGSLPFCEKSEEGLLSTSLSPDGGNGLDLSTQSSKDDQCSHSLISNMLNWWRDWDEQCAPLMKQLGNEKMIELRSHILTHHDKLLKMEKEFQNIVKRRQGNQSTPSSRKSSNSFSTSSPASRRSSSNYILDSRSLGFVGETFNDTQGSQISTDISQRTPGPIAPVVSPSRRSSRYESLESVSQEFSPDSLVGTPYNQSLPNLSPRSSGTSVSQLISMFELSSRSSSPVVPERGDRSGVVDCNSNVSKDLKLESECASMPGDFVSPVSGERKFVTLSPPDHSPYNFMRDSKILNRSKLVRQNVFSEELGGHFIPASQPGNSALENQSISSNTEEDLVDPLPMGREMAEVLDSGFEQEVEYCIITAGTHPVNTYQSRNGSKVNEGKFYREFMDIDKKGVILDTGLDDDDSDTERDMQKAVDENVATPLKRRMLVKCNTGSSVGSPSVEMDLEIDTDVYMENSQLMKLMKEVKEQEVLIKSLKRQVTEAEEQKETCVSMLTRLHRLVMEVSGCTFMWTEGVRKEWLASVPVRREDEGATDPLRTPDPLDDGGPLTTTHSREEIESLIHTRCDLGCRLSREDFSKEYVNPENLAIELERELLALKLHVARSHALLHHYQSSSLHGSRSEVSTPPVSTFHHVQGVEAGVEVDLCGPTCIPRPCDSTATQTPASPISVSPECEASVGEEATGSICGSNDGVSDDLLQDDHRPLTPQHRPLYQRMSVSEEEVDEDSGCGRDMAAAVSSDHALYAPKPTYDQLDQYSSLSKRNEREKQRRSGLATIAPKNGGGSSDSEEDEEETKKLLTLCSSPLRNRHLLNRHPRCHSDPEVAPLSPPPSLDKEEEEEEELTMKETEESEDNVIHEGEPELPSTPESNPSNASAPPVFPSGDVGVTGEDIPKHLPQVNVIPSTCSAPNTPTAPTFDLDTPRSASAPWVPSEQPLLDPVRPRSSSWIGSASTVFPSLQDAHLRALGVSVQDTIPNENLSAQEIENKFKQISLAFKTDRITLKQRLEVQQRQRDIAEANFDRELKLLETSILALHEDCIDMELVDAIMQIRKHLDVLTISSTSLLSASEDANINYHFDVDAVMDKVWGAVQQEWRVSRALEVLLLHVENVKRLYENDHQELEEMRKLLNEHQIEYPANPAGGGSGQSTTSDSASGSIRIRALSLAGVSKQSQESGNRRISLRDYLGGRNSARRASLMPDLGLFHQEIAAAAVAAAASKAAKEKLEEKRHSTNGMLGNSITEEGSESGDEASGNTRPATGDSSPTASAGAKNNSFQFDAFSQALQDSDQRSNEENSSSFHPPPADSLGSSVLNTGFIYHPFHWAMQGFEDFIGWLRGGRWPFSSQQTYQGVRYLFTSFLLMLAVLFLLLTISSGDEAQQPCHPGWTTIHHLLHPYVTIRHSGPAEY